MSELFIAFFYQGVIYYIIDNERERLMDAITHDLAAALRNIDPHNSRLAAYDAIVKLVENVPDFNWRILAGRGEIISAIKELRFISGLGLYEAKMVVQHYIAKLGPPGRE